LQNNIVIMKDNLLFYYHKAQTVALKPTTIKSAFRKTGIHPFDHSAIPLSTFKPAKNTTTQAAQPLPAQATINSCSNTRSFPSNISSNYTNQMHLDLVPPPLTFPWLKHQGIGQ
jgi:hypothetical protein